MKLAYFYWKDKNKYFMNKFFIDMKIKKKKKTILIKENKS